MLKELSQNQALDERSTEPIQAERLRLEAAQKLLYAVSEAWYGCHYGLNELQVLAAAIEPLRSDPAALDPLFQNPTTYKGAINKIITVLSEANQAHERQDALSDSGAKVVKQALIPALCRQIEVIERYSTEENSAGTMVRSQSLRVIAEIVLDQTDELSNDRVAAERFLRRHPEVIRQEIPHLSIWHNEEGSVYYSPVGEQSFRLSTTALLDSPAFQAAAAQEWLQETQHKHAARILQAALTACANQYDMVSYLQLVNQLGASPQTQAVDELSVSLMMKTSAGGELMCRRRLEQYGLPADAMMHSWRRAIDHEDRARSTRQFMANFRAMATLERAYPGACATLRQKYGIELYGRYPAHLLLEQAQNADAASSDEPHGIVLFPKADYNGAFFDDRAIIDSLSRQLIGRFTLRIAEAGSRFAAISRIARLTRQYGPATFAIVGGHGTQDSIAFGEWSDRSRSSFQLTRADLVDNAAKRGQRFFTQSPTIILVSCSTGVNEGIGQQLSEVLEARVIAPNTPTGLRAITATFDADGQPNFSVEYSEKNETVEYGAGQVIHPSWNF